MDISETELIDYQLNKEALLNTIIKAHLRRTVFLKIVFLPALFSILYMIYKVTTNFNEAVNEKGLLGFILTKSGVATSFLILCAILALYMFVSISIRIRERYLIRKFKKSYGNEIEPYEKALANVKWIENKDAQS